MFSGIVWLKDIKLQMNVMLGLENSFFQCGIKLFGIPEDPDGFCGTGREMVDAGEEVKKLAITFGHVLQKDRSVFICGGRGSGPEAVAAGGEKFAPFEALALETVRADTKKDKRSKERDENDRPKPGQGRGGPFFQPQEMGNCHPGAEIAQNQKCRHERLALSLARN
jgi:hypothetical protein